MTITGFPLWRLDRPLVLASGSATRREMLLAAGIPLEVRASDIDERQAEAGARSAPDMPPETFPMALAQHLAVAKALDVSRRTPDRLVLGADQTLSCDGQILHKPAGRAEAVRQLSRLSGKSHQLHAAMAIARNGAVVASGSASARLTMRALSPDFIAAYVDATLPDILSSVGGYQIEGPGIQLFARVEGDHFTILGLPLLGVLNALRELEALKQ